MGSNSSLKYERSSCLEFFTSKLSNILYIPQYYFFLKDYYYYYHYQKHPSLILNPCSILSPDSEDSRGVSQVQAAFPPSSKGNRNK